MGVPHAAVSVFIWSLRMKQIAKGIDSDQMYSTNAPAEALKQKEALHCKESFAIDKLCESERKSAISECSDEYAESSEEENLHVIENRKEASQGFESSKSLTITDV